MSKLQYIGKKDGNEPFRVINSKLFKEELDRLPDGRYRITVEKYRKNKSNAQLGYLFACIYPFVFKALIDAGWEITSLDQVDALCKEKFASQDIVNRDTAEIITIPGLKREMNTLEFSTYVSSIRNWCAEYLNTYIPEPGEQMMIEI